MPATNATTTVSGVTVGTAPRPRSGAGKSRGSRLVASGTSVSQTRRECDREPDHQRQRGPGGQPAAEVTSPTQAAETGSRSGLSAIAPTDQDRCWLDHSEAGDDSGDDHEYRGSAAPPGPAPGLRRAGRPIPASRWSAMPGCSGASRPERSGTCAAISTSVSGISRWSKTATAASGPVGPDVAGDHLSAGSTSCDRAM